MQLNTMPSQSSFSVVKLQALKWYGISVIYEMIKEFSTFVHARLQTLAKALNSPLHGF